MTADDQRPHTRPQLRTVDDDHAATPPADHAAEQALLATLIHHPHLADDLHSHLEDDDFYWPVHATLWQAIHHHVTTHGPDDFDPIVLNAHLVRSRHTDAARLLADVLTLDTNPTQATAYAGLVRDQARLRAVDQLATKLRTLVNRGSPDQIDTAMEAAVDALDAAYNRFGPTPATTGDHLGLKDLSWLLGGTPPVVDPPTWTHRTDGSALFYAGKVNGIFGDPESAKTWIAMTAAIEALAAGQKAAILDVDHNGPIATATRLLQLGAHPEHLADPDRFRYYEPEDPEQLRAAITDLVNRPPAVLIIDSIGEVFPMLECNSNNPDEVTMAMRLVATGPANAGACVILIDHLPKAHEAREAGSATGSLAKKRPIRGSYIQADARTQPAPGQVGRITLRIKKDTFGELRRTSGGGYAGTFTLDSTDPDTLRWDIAREDAPRNTDGTFRPTGYMEKVSRFVEDNDQESARVIEDGVGGKREHVRTAMKLLISEGYISTISGARNSKLHHSVIAYREAEDDQT